MNILRDRAITPPLTLSALLMLLCMAMLVAVGLNTTPAASADTLTVTKTDDTNDGNCSESDCSLREAIIAANGRAGADVIIVPGGTYRLGISGADEDEAARGDLDITDDLTIRGRGADRTIIDGNEIDRIFHILGDVTVELAALSARNGRVETTALPQAHGGGLHNDGGKVTITDSAISSNQTLEGEGGGIYNGSGEINIANSAILNNFTHFDVGDDGGGVANHGKATITNSTISGNRSGDAYGGGVANLSEGELTINNSTLSKNHGQFGGGGAANFGVATITNTDISLNSTDNPGGGGIHNDGTLTFQSGTILGNESLSDGGGVYNTGDVRFIDSIIAYNSAMLIGGGIFNDLAGPVNNDLEGTVNLEDTVVIANTAPTSPNCHNVDCTIAPGPIPSLPPPPVDEEERDSAEDEEDRNSKSTMPQSPAQSYGEGAHPLSVTAQATVPAFPGAEGHGARAVGGRGGRVIQVTTLSDSGPGSLRAAIQASGPRIVVFRVAGYIDLRSQLQIVNPFITIAGQTAPGGGITLRRAAGVAPFNGIIRFPNPTDSAIPHDVIIRYLRIREGAGTADRGKNISMLSGDNIIVDHVSMSWTTDNNVGIFLRKRNPSHVITDVTIQNSILAEPFYNHPTGMNISGDKEDVQSPDFEDVERISVHDNLFANSSYRNPLLTTGGTAVINNLVYNWGQYASGTTRSSVDDFIGNYYKAGPMSRPRINVHEEKDWPFPPSIYFEGNIAPNRGFPNPNVDNWEMIEIKETGAPLPNNYRRFSRLPPGPFPVSIQSATAVFDSVLANAGANARLDCEGNFVSNRDSIDNRVVNNARNGTGPSDPPRNQSEFGGYPAIATGTPCADADSDGMPNAWENRFGLNPNNAADSSRDNDGDGYTNIEEYLNGTPPTTPTTPTPTPTATPTTPTPTPTATPTPTPTPTATPTPTPAPFATCDGERATIVGTAGNNNITGTSGRDVIQGLGGNDTIDGLGGDDLICGGPGDDTIYGRSGDDTILGEEGNDTLIGNAGNDTLRGGPGDDSLFGRLDDDSLFGEQDNDRLDGGPGRDRCDGGAGVNTIENCEA